MNEIHIRQDNHGRKAFVIEGGGKRLAEMEFSTKDGILTVYHIQVAEELEGKGIASSLLNEMVAYARKHELKVVPLCPFVHAQFKRDPKKYNDLWLRS